MRGYDTSAVDAFLDQICLQENDSEPARLSTDPWRDLAVWDFVIRRQGDDLSGGVGLPPQQPSSKKDRSRTRKDFALDCAAAWRDFGQVPGTRLTWVRTGANRRELQTSDRQTLVSFRRGLVSAGGRSLKVRDVRKADWPSAARTFNLSPISRDQGASQVVDEAGLPILYNGGRNFNRSAGAYIKFSDQRLLRFPVRGTDRGNAIMTAVDQAGNMVARYRRLPVKPWWDGKGTVEITVHPEQRLTDDLALAIALSARWLWTYFQSEGGGG